MAVHGGLGRLKSCLDSSVRISQRSRIVLGSECKDRMCWGYTGFLQLRTATRCAGHVPDLHPSFLRGTSRINDSFIHSVLKHCSWRLEPPPAIIPVLLLEVLNPPPCSSSRGVIPAGVPKQHCIPGSPPVCFIKPSKVSFLLKTVTFLTFCRFCSKHQLYSKQLKTGFKPHLTSREAPRLRTVLLVQQEEPGAGRRCHRLVMLLLTRDEGVIVSLCRY